MARESIGLHKSSTSFQHNTKSSERLVPAAPISSHPLLHTVEMCGLNKEDEFDRNDQCLPCSHLNRAHLQSCETGHVNAWCTRWGAGPPCMKMPVRSNCTWKPTYTLARLIVGDHHNVKRRFGIWFRPLRCALVSFLYFLHIPNARNPVLDNTQPELHRNVN